MSQNSAAAPARSTQIQEDPQKPRRRPRWIRVLTLLGVAILLIIASGVVYAALHWPFSHKSVAESLQEDFPGKITFAHFRKVYFPRPGCVAEGLTLQNPKSLPGSPPLVYVQRFVLRANYHDLLFRPGYISSIALEGLHIRIPPRGQAGESLQQSPSNTRVGEVKAKGVVLEVARADRNAPLKFEIHAITLNSVSRKSSIGYDVAFHNPLPPGEIQSRGRFGPWNTADPGQTPVSGTYQFDSADLSVFDGIAGILSSHDSFQGVLARIAAHGKVDIPDFQVTRSVHKVHLRASYDAFVNAFNGDVELPRVEATVQQTAIVATGSVAGRPGTRGKTTSLDFSVRNGRYQDLLRLITHEPEPAFNGLTNLRAHVEIPPEGRPFLKELNVTGDFVIVDGRFTKSKTQKEVTDLSSRSRGKKPPENIADSLNQNIRSSVTGHVVVKNGTAALTDLRFAVPGALADLHGTFNTLNERINFHGTLQTDVSFSETTGGIKSLLLKPFDAMFKRKPKGANIPVKLDGTYSDPHPGVELTGDTKQNQPKPTDTDKEEQKPQR
jgi:AsmA-like C-terminal region